MNDQMPSPAHCRQQPELGRPAGWFASGLCLGMKSPWLGAMLPWQWGGGTGMAVGACRTDWVSWAPEP